MAFFNMNLVMYKHLPTKRKDSATKIITKTLNKKILENQGKIINFGRAPIRKHIKEKNKYHTYTLTINI